MNIRVFPALLEGSVIPPPSKSQAHRALMAAALSGGFSVLKNLAPSQDIQATTACLSAMGSRFVPMDNGDIQVHGLGYSIPQHREPWLTQFNCGESGSTLRFMIPVALFVQGGGQFAGRGRLMERPQKPYFDIFDEKGVFYEQKDGALTVKGELAPGEYRLPGNISSQFVTGLLYTLPLLKGGSEIVLTSQLESKGYVDMTLEMLGRFGIRIEVLEGGFSIPGGQRYRPCDLTVEADWSQAAFWYAAAFLGSRVEARGLKGGTCQGDEVIERLTSRLSQPGDMEIDVSNCPDLVPALALMAAVRSGTARLINAARLRMKESDRLASVTQVLTALGAQVEEGPDFLKITGVSELAGGVTVDCCNDHRIAMMAAVAATRCKEPVTLLGAECVRKSYPYFWDDYRKLGGKFDVL